MAKVKKGFADLAVLVLPEVYTDTDVVDEVDEKVVDEKVPEKGVKVYRHSPYERFVKAVNEHRRFYTYTVISQITNHRCRRYLSASAWQEGCPLSYVDGRVIAEFDSVEEAHDWVSNQPEYGSESVEPDKHEFGSGGWGSGGMTSGRWRD